jgi:tetratricopeptide (TPR) repeat protein
LDASVLAQFPLFDGVTAQQLGAVLADLGGLGLVDYRAAESAAGGVDVVVLHPLVRQTTRHQADVIEQADAYQAAQLALLDSATTGLRYNDPTVWPLWRLVLPHCVQNHLPVLAPGPDERRAATLARLHQRAAGFCDEIGWGVQAEDFYRRALTVRSRVLGADHPDTLTTRHDLARAWRKRGHLTGAESEYRDVLTTRERVLGVDHPDTLTTRNNLALVLRARGDLAGAEAEFRDVLTTRERVLGADHPSTLNTRNNLASVLQDRGDLAGAEAEFRDVLTTQERVLGADHPHTLITQHNLASVLHDRGDLAGAEAEFRDVLTTRERVWGADHPSTLTTRNNLVSVLQARRHSR